MLEVHGSPFRVLCVDDNRDVADSTAAVLTLVGYLVRTCYDGPSAIRLVKSFQPNACLIDFHMPGMNGDELAAQIREQVSGRLVRLVAFTAMSDERTCRLIKAAAFDRHLVKPAALADLLAALGGPTLVR